MRRRARVIATFSRRHPFCLLRTPKFAITFPASSGPYPIEKIVTSRSSPTNRSREANPRSPRLGKLLTESRRRNGWLREGSQGAQQQTLRTYAQALDHSFTVKRRGRPQFKARKKARPSLEYTTRGFTIRDDRLVLAKRVSIPVVWSRDLPSEPTSVTVYQEQPRALVRLVRRPPYHRDHPASVRWSRGRLGRVHHGHRERCRFRPALPRAPEPPNSPQRSERWRAADDPKAKCPRAGTCVPNTMQ